MVVVSPLLHLDWANVPVIPNPDKPCACFIKARIALIWSPRYFTRYINSLIQTQWDG
jgi:hypothetical protein